jgi:uncharacterized membrane protein (UPF0136 family)
MTGQTKRGSLTETLAGTAIGFAISWAATPPILAVFGYQAGAGTAFGITVVYTVLSIVRGYAVRRLFNWIHTRPKPEPERTAVRRTWRDRW